LIEPPTLLLAAKATAGVGEPASVTLVNRSAVRVRGELAFDDNLLQPAAAAQGAGVGRCGFGVGRRPAVVQHHVPAVGGQVQRDGAADAARGAGDQGRRPGGGVR
jgi:hypothetical protein